MATPAATPNMPEAKGRRRRLGSADERIERKRELDRIAQRASRERARARTQHLEEKLKSLQAEDKQEQISYLMNTIEELRRENTELRRVTEKIKFLAEAAAKRPGCMYNYC
jgi:hypothetical protein